MPEDSKGDSTYQVRKARRIQKEIDINGIHATRLQLIRPFVNFDYKANKPLTKYQKQKIYTYWKEIDELNARPAMAYRPRRKDHLKTAQEFAGHEKNLPGLKVAFIPVADPKSPPKIRFDKKGDLVATTKHVSTRYIPLPKLATVKDPESYVKKAMAKHPKARQFTIKAGKYEIPNAESKTSLPRKIMRLMEKYTKLDKKGKENNHYFENWLHGFDAHTFTNQDDFSDYVRTRYNEKVKIKKKRKSNKSKKTRGVK